MQIFSPIALTRISLTTVAITLVTRLALQHYLPDLDVDWGPIILKCIGFTVLLLASCFAIVLVPPSVTVSSQGILVSQGQSCRLHRFDDLAKCSIVEEKREVPVLVLRRRDAAAVREFAISPRVSLTELAGIIKMGRKEI